MLRRSSLSWSLCWVLLAAALTGADCRSNDKPTPLDSGAKAATEGEAPPNEGLTEAEAAKLLPGIDTGVMTPKQRQDLVDLSRDTFCPCSADTVAACVRKGPGTCKAAVRMLELAERMLVQGMPEARALMYIEAYYSGFDDAHRVELGAEGHPVRGAAGARVVMQEFSDFQCPVCRAAHPILTEVLKKYPVDLKWVFRFFPLPQHEHAAKAALVGAYAFLNGGNEKFWKVADHFFTHQDALGDDEYKAALKDAGLNPTEGLAAAEKDASKYVDLVEGDKKAGTDAKLAGTPSVYLNGRSLVIPPTPDNLSWAIEDELEWMSNGKSWK